MSTILATGAAGFIGYHVTHQLLQQGYTVGMGAMLSRLIPGG